MEAASVIDYNAKLHEHLEFSHSLSLTQGSGIDPEVVLERGYRTVTGKAELRGLGFSSTQQLVPALLVPMYSPSGELVAHQIKPDVPRSREGKPVKYETPAGSGVHLDVHPSQGERLKDPTVPLWVTEGVKKGDCLTSRGQCAVALQGVWCWKKDGVALPGWEDIRLRGRRTFVAFDSDVMTKSEVQAALTGLVDYLKLRGALVKIVYLPEGKAGEKQGVDDYLASGGTIEELEDFAEDGLRANVSEVGTLLSEVEPERVEWLWEGRIPKGKLTILDGDPGLGKSLITQDLAARITTGRSFPDDAVRDLDGVGGLGGVVLLSAEDGQADTIRPRLDAAGADAGKVLAVCLVSDGKGGERTVSIPEDIGTIERAIERIDAKLVVIDPLMAFLSRRVNANSDQDVRQALTPLGKMAERLGVAVLVVRHMNKQETRKSLYRGGGSIGIIGAARSALMVEKHPTDKDVRVLAMAKGNLAKKAESLTYRITTSDGIARIRWEGTIDLDADELVNPDTSEAARAEAWLRAVLKDGPVLRDDIEKWSEKVGISWRTLERVKRELRIKSKKDGVNSKWRWYPLDEDRQDRQLRQGEPESGNARGAEFPEAS